MSADRRGACQGASHESASHEGASAPAANGGGYWMAVKPAVKPFSEIGTLKS